VREGEILGLVGPNGSGKTTLINVISGFYPLTSGSVTWPASRSATCRRTRSRARRGAHLPDPAAVREHDGAGERRAGGDLRQSARAAAEIRDEALHWIGFTGLAGKEEVLPAGLNLHERKFLELARALGARPRLLLLDEVLSGLNPAEVDNAIRLVRAIRAQGATIVFVEHLMRAVVELSDRIAVLNEGKLFALGAPREVMRDPRVVSIYLGKAYAA
jgi:branched-chain amino acid transport system permease protein